MPPTTESKPEPRAGDVRALAAFIRPHVKTLVAGLLLAIGAAASALTLPIITRNLLSELGTSGPATATLVLLSVLLVGTAVVGYLQANLLGRLGERIVLNARVTMVNRLFRARIGVLSKHTSGELATRVVADTTLLRQATTANVVALVRAAIVLNGALILMVILDPVLTAATVGTLVVVSGGAILIAPRLAVANKYSQESVGRLGGSLEGALRAIRTVKSSAAEDREAARVLGHAQEAARQGVRAVRISAVFGVILSAGLQLCIMIILGLGAVRVASGALDVPTLIAFLLYSFQLAEPLTLFGSTLPELQAGMVAATRIRDIQQMSTEVDNGKAMPSTGLSNQPSVLEFHRLEARHSPDAPPALRGVDLNIPNRGHVAIVGPSGAGKTTMFGVMLRFVDAGGGNALLEGIPINDWPLASLRRRIVYVEQDSPLLPGTVRDNVAYVRPEANDDEIWGALHAVRLDKRVRSLPGQLDNEIANATISGGERQRFALARAIVARPKILLLDEATAQLDGMTESVVHSLINDLSKTGVVISIAHRLSTVIDADQIVVLQAGLVRAVGTHQELLTSDELYRSLVAALRISTSPDAQIAAQLDEVARADALDAFCLLYTSQVRGFVRPARSSVDGEP